MFYSFGIAVAVILAVMALFGENKFSRLVLIAACFGIFTLFKMVFIVSPGQVGFLETFGKLSYKTYDMGFHPISPFSERKIQNIRRQSLDYTDEETAEGLSFDRVMLSVDVTIPYIINPSTAPLLYERYGSGNSLIKGSGRKAIRDCTAEQNWQDIVSNNGAMSEDEEPDQAISPVDSGPVGRAALEECVQQSIDETTQQDMVKTGLSPEDAQRVFTFPKPQVRKIDVQNRKILDAIAEEKAADALLRRQTTLTAIAEEEARRRANEGSGINLMMEKLPKNYQVSEMVALIHANAAKANAEAFQKAVENGNVKITVVTGDTAPVAVKAN